MKKSIIILGTTLTILSLLFLSFTNWTNKDTKTSIVSTEKINADENLQISGPNIKVLPDLYYDIDTRFVAIKKTDIDKARTIYDFLKVEEQQKIAYINSVEIVMIKDNAQSEIREYGTSEQLNEAQLKFLRATDYFSHFTIRTEFKEKNIETGKLEERFFGPHITVVPDKQALYVNGNDALIDYLKDNSRNEMYLIEGNRLGALKIEFTITKEGTITGVKHDAMTSGYKAIDEKFSTLIKNIPGKWAPAENSKGEKIEQELVFTFGPVDGC